MNYKFTFTLILILIINQALSIESAFLPSIIVNLQNDTIDGTGKMHVSQEYCLFKETDASDYKKYFPNEVGAFRIMDGKYYIPRKITEEDGEQKWYFLEYLIDGEIDLFVLSNSVRFFMEKEDGEFLELNDRIESIKKIEGRRYLKQDKKYLGYLRLYMADTPEFFSRINKMNRLNQRELVALSIDYHNVVCNDSECINYTKKIPNVTSKFEWVTGISRHNNYYSPQYGFLVHVWSPLKNEKLFLKAGILYSDQIYEEKSFTRKDEYNYKIKFPVSLQYVFGNKKLKPSLAIGWPTGLFISSIQGGFIYSISRNIELNINASADGLLAYTKDKHKTLYNNDFGHTFNFGLIYYLNNSKL